MYNIRILCSAMVAFLSLGLGSCTKPVMESADDYVVEDTAQYTINTYDMNIRDPFIIVDREAKCYYLIQSRKKDNRPGALFAYKSLNLSKWKEVGYISQVDSNYIGTKDFWAPDYYKYKGNYYCFITVSGENILRGTTIFKGGHKPLDEYKPILPANQLNITPSDMQSLDGSLFVDHLGVPYMVFAQEWKQVHDGKIWAMKLKDDLSGAAGVPFLLFSASQAPWSISGGGDENYITDAPFIWKDKASGNLIMTWSSMSVPNEAGKQNYTIGQAISRSGNIEGPWEHDPTPLWSTDGGHAMIFEDLNNNLKICFHAPNSNGERVRISDIHITNGKFDRFDQSVYNPSYTISSKVFKLIYKNNTDYDDAPLKDPSRMFDGNVESTYATKWYGYSASQTGPYTKAAPAPYSGYYPDWAVFPPYIFVIDMQRRYSLEQVKLAVRVASLTDPWNFGKVKNVEYWISNDDLSGVPDNESMANATVGWTKIGENYFSPTDKGFKPTNVSQVNTGRYLKLVLPDFHYPGLAGSPGVTNPQMGWVGFAELALKGIVK